MNDLYIHNLETENKQLRLALQECRKALEEEITTKKKAIEYINEELYCSGNVVGGTDLPYLYIEELLKILGGKENDK